MKKKLFMSLFILFLSIFLLTGCGKTTTTENKNITGKTTTEVGPINISTEDQNDPYEQWLNSWSQSGHLYIHYQRPDAQVEDYSKYCLWIWQHAPKDLEGSLWAASSEKIVNFGLNRMTDHFMTGEEVGRSEASTYIDQYGIIIDVDLYRDDLIDGKTGSKVSFKGATNVGFLICDENSMDGSSNWVSDGGRETYITNFDKHFRSNGAMHVFVVSGMLSKYVFRAQDVEVKTNPVTTDNTGKYRSLSENLTKDYGIPKTSDSFSSLGVGYEIFVASFRDSDGDGLGDIRGIIDALPYLSGLGIQALWLTPIQKSDSYHGYDIMDYYAIDPKFGTINDYRELIYKAHKLGIKVLMDLVLNHTSKGNIWFEKSQWAETGVDGNGNAINYRDVYRWKFESDTILKYNPETSKYETITVKEDALSDNPSWYRDGESKYYYYGKFGSGMPELNYDSQATRNLVIDMAKYWLSFGLDGFRLDAVKHLYMKDEVDDTGSDTIIQDIGTKTSYDDEKKKMVTKAFDYSSDLDKNLQFWKEFSAKLKNIYPDCFLVAENFDGYGARTAPYYNAFDSQFNFTGYYHNLSKVYQYGASSYVAGPNNEYNETYLNFYGTGSVGIYVNGVVAYTVPQGKRPDAILGSFTSNHDVYRSINMVNGVANVDDVTPNTEIKGTIGEIGRAKVAAAITLLTPGLSWIYYGDELGMSSNTNTHEATYGSENSMDIWYRQPFLWKESSITPNYKAGQYTFELDSYNKTLKKAEDQMSDQNSMYNFYKQLIEVKKTYPKSARVRYDDQFSSNNVLVMDITTQSGQVVYKIFINTGYDNSDYGVNASGYTLYKNIGNGNPQSFGSSSYSVLIYKAN